MQIWWAFLHCSKLDLTNYTWAAVIFFQVNDALEGRGKNVAETKQLFDVMKANIRQQQQQQQQLRSGDVDMREDDEAAAGQNQLRDGNPVGDLVP